MYFYVEAVDLDPNDSDSIEILEGSQSKTIISANYYSGLTFNTGGIPDYLATKIGIISDLDVFEMNGLQYIKEGEIEQERYGQSTSIQCSLKLTQKNEVGLNVDDLGITNTDTTMAIVPIRNTGVTTAGAVIENPEGYMLHSIFIRHALTSAAATAVVTIGTTLAGTDLIDAMQGSITLASYPSTGKFKGYSRHFLKNPDAASNVYIAVSGTGAVMDIIINFDTVIDTTS